MKLIFVDYLSNQINIKYPNGTKELSLMEKEEFLEEFANILDRRLSDNINPTADIVIIKKVLVTGLSGLIINRERPLYNDIVQNLVLKNASMMILECLSESVLFTNISNISVEKIINESSEKVAVRLKITLNDTKSEEILLKLEKIQNNWKVVNPTSFN